MGNDSKLGSVTIPRELFDFLMGSGEIDGTSFGDLNDRLPGRFWWRSLLRTAENNPPSDLNSELVAALETLFASYKALADSGDAGHWSLEEQPEGKQALAALAKTRPSDPLTTQEKPS